MVVEEVVNSPTMEREGWEAVVSIHHEVRAGEVAVVSAVVVREVERAVILAEGMGRTRVGTAELMAVVARVAAREVGREVVVRVVARVVERVAVARVVSRVVPRVVEMMVAGEKVAKMVEEEWVVGRGVVVEWMEVVEARVVGDVARAAWGCSKKTYGTL